MKRTDFCFLTVVTCVAAILFICLLSRCSTGLKNHVIIENDKFRYEIGQDGRNRCFIDKLSGVDYLLKDSNSVCAYTILNGIRHPVSEIFLKDSLLTFCFNNTGVVAELVITREKDYFTLKVTSVSGSPESFTFLNIPLALEGLPDEPFAACALSLNQFTHIKQLPALQDHLWATCYQRFGLKGAEIALVGVPRKEILPVIRKVMEHADSIPKSLAGGAWAQLGKEGYGSYLMNYGTLTEQTVNDWIRMCKSLGFNQIDNHGIIDNFNGNVFFRFGDFELNKTKWPDGWTNFKNINQKLHQAGISAIFHTYAFFIDKNSRYVHPVPSPDLAYFDGFTLASPVGPEDTTITVNEPTAGISTITGWRIANSVVLRIGGELVEFSGVTGQAPYKFTGCKRGFLGTKASAHPAGDEAFHLKELFGLFLPGPETALFEEIARRTAEIVNECHFDGIYLDAIDASHILGGEENFWYYGSRFIFEIAKNLDHPVGMEMSSMSHHWWHYRSRWQAWDRPTRGYKKFVDIHIASIKTDEYEHGHWKGNTPLIQKYAPLENGGLLLPLHLGWWGNQSWDPPQKEPTFIDDVEYLCCKMIGNNAGISMLGGADETTLNNNPGFRRLNNLIRQYEELRLQHYFNDDIRRILREPGKEFTLFRDHDSTWNFKPVTCQKHKITGLNNSSAQWTVHNEFSTQAVKLRIEPLMSVKPFDSPEGIVMADFTDTAGFMVKVADDGISGSMESTVEKSPDGGSCAVFTAKSQGKSPRDASWIGMEKKFFPPLNLQNNQGLGIWIKGDGSGQVLCLRELSPEHLITAGNGDHLVKIDFTGWRYFELIELGATEYSDYVWPGSGTFNDLYVYKNYRNTLVFSSIDKLQIWYNNLPERKRVSCAIGPVKALPLVQITINNPSVTIGGNKIVFPVKMTSGMYIEFNSVADCKLYGPKGELLKEITPEGTIPDLVKGDNLVSFSCNGPAEINSRVQVTVISEGEPL